MPTPKKKPPAKQGRPAKYTEADKMQQAIEAYFDSLHRDAELGDRPPTMAGLARALGFTNRASLNDYSEKPEFTNAIKKAKARIEEWWEERLASTGPTGSIFWLKNHAGYADKQEITGAEGKPFEITIRYV